MFHVAVLKKEKLISKLFFEKDAYIPGETAYMVAEVENNSKVKMNAIEGVFTQLITLRGGGLWTNTRHFNHNLLTLKSHGLEPGAKAIGDQAVRLAVPLKGAQITGGEDAGCCNTTTHGKLVECDYFIAAVGNMDACICCDSNPQSRVKLEIFNPAQAKMAPFMPPQNWAPKVYDTYIANLVPQFEVKIEIS